MPDATNRSGRRSISPIGVRNDGGPGVRNDSGGMPNSRFEGAIGHVGGKSHNAAHGSLGVAGLVLVGVGGIIGAGFFLGAGLPIHTAGPSVLISFVIGALVTAQVTGALASIALREKGRISFVGAATRYIGDFAGFLQGWAYYISSIITVASEAVAMSIFTRLWLPAIPSWMMAAAYALVVIAINAFGVRNFGRVESLMSVVKIGALVGFIVFLGYEVIALPAVFGAHSPHFGPHIASGLGGVTSTSGAAGTIAGTGGAAAGTAGGLFSFHSFFPHGWDGVFQSMLIVIFSYAGIGVFATATTEMRRPSDVNKAAWLTVLILVVLYLFSVGLLLWVLPWQVMSTSVSPFVAALHLTSLPVLAQVLNGIILVASFSVMAGAVFSANLILEGLGRDGDAPGFVLWSIGNRTPAGALAVTTGVVAVIMFVAHVLPANVYNFMISASSFLTFLSWFLILWTFLAWRRRDREGHWAISSLAFGQPWSSLLTMLFILFMSGYALRQHDQRFGFYAAVVMLVAIALAYFVRAVVFPRSRKQRSRLPQTGAES